ncbi:SGNH/GDSL hydrolase family protein [soil metagenome]
MKIQKGSKLVMIGDSITDADRTKPIGEGLFGALGKGYVSQVEALLTSAHPGERIRVVNQGLSGNTVRDLKSRWEKDVLDLKPDWLSIMIGINDVWRQFDLPLQTEVHVLPEEYSATLEELVAQTRPKLKGLVLMTPFVIEPNKADPMRMQMDRYSAIVRDLAARYDATFVDVQAAFDAVLEHYHAMNFAWDRIHPGTSGHMVISRAFLKGIGYSW